MNIFSIIIKIIACFLLMFFDLAAFAFGLSCLAGGGEHDSIKDCITYTNTDSISVSEKSINSLTNKENYTLNGGFYTNRFTSCDVITKKGATEVIFND